MRVKRDPSLRSLRKSLRASRIARRGRARVRLVSHLPSTLPQAGPQGKTALVWRDGYASQRERESFDADWLRGLMEGGGFYGVFQVGGYAGFGDVAADAGLCGVAGEVEGFEVGDDEDFGLGSVAAD